ncbi:MAG: hypothetical protein HEEMFOPI_01457 [Holosporales bacterium]
MINLKMLKEIGLMVALISQAFAATPCISTEEPFYRKWRGCDMPSERGAIEGESRVVRGNRWIWPNARGYLSFNTINKLDLGLYLIRFNTTGSSIESSHEKVIMFSEMQKNVETYNDMHMPHKNDENCLIAPYNLSSYDGNLHGRYSTKNDRGEVIQSNYEGAVFLMKIEKKPLFTNFLLWALNGTIFINSIEIIRVGDNGFSSHPMMRDIPSPFYQMMRSHFTDIVQRGFYCAFAALGDTVENHQNREHHTNEFLRRADPLGNPGFQPLRYFCNALDSRFTRLDDRSNGLESRITHVNDAQSARITSLESRLQQALSGIETMNERINSLEKENKELKTIAANHQGMVEHIERTTTPIRSVSAGRRARN